MVLMLFPPTWQGDSQRYLDIRPAERGPRWNGWMGRIENVSWANWVSWERPWQLTHEMNETVSSRKKLGVQRNGVRSIYPVVFPYLLCRLRGRKWDVEFLSCFQAAELWLHGSLASSSCVCSRLPSHPRGG